MSTVVSLESARQRRKRLSERELYNVSPFMSPVPNLIELLEPILDRVRSQNGGSPAQIRADLYDFLDVLALGHQEIDQLEDMARFLLQICDDREAGIHD